MILGSGGRNGATGNFAARQLLAMGLPVRAFVRRADERADELRALGAEIVVGDVRDFEVVRAALDGVQRAYFTYPIAEGLLEATATFAAAAKQAGLHAIVIMSQSLRVRLVRTIQVRPRANTGYPSDCSTGPGSASRTCARPSFWRI